jgi:penicillin-binding protein 2
VSRYHDYSYAGQRPAPRWPWVLLLLIVAGAPVVLFALVQAGLVDGQPIRDAVSEYFPLPPAPEEQPALIPESPTAAPERATEQDPATPPPSTVVPSTPPEETAARYAQVWAAGDYNALYDLLTIEAQAMISREDFVNRYVSIGERIGLSGLRVTIAGAADPSGEVPIETEFETTTVGDFTAANTIPLVAEDGAWKVDWSPSLIFAQLGADGCIDIEQEQVRRGRILDRNGQVLAYDGTVWRVGIVPNQIDPATEAEVMRKLAELTEFTEAELRERYAEADPSWFVPIKDFPEERGEELLQLISQLPGASVQPAVARVYPLGAQAAHVTGYVSTVTAEQMEADPALMPGQIIGQAGIEAGANELLAGEAGGRIIVVQCDTRAERATIAERTGAPPKDLILTIDSALQIETDAALTAQGDELKGSAVVLDPRDGAVLAMVSHPSYDPNGFVLGFPEEQWDDINDRALRPLLNRAAQAAYPTGSIFKPITFVAAMDDLGYTPDKVFDCPSTFSLEGASQVWEDWTVASGMGPQGPLTLHQALVNSCNTIFYQLGRDLDQRDDGLLPAMARAFGLGAPTDIPYLPEIAGTLPSPDWKLETFGDYWATGDAVNLAIGQGFLEATPLQMATAYAAIANGGDLLQPYIVAATVEDDGEPEPVGDRTVRAELPVSDATVAAVQAALRDQTSDWNGYGSVRVFGDFPWPIAGKTGTAQNQMDARTHLPHSWFAGFGPYGAEATIASVVMIENAGEGVAFAAPITRQIYQQWLNLCPNGQCGDGAQVGRPAPGDGT